MNLRYKQVKISQLVLKILLIFTSFIFIFNAYKLSKLNVYDSFAIVLQLLKSSLSGMKISYIFIIIFLLLNAGLTAISYILFKENILDDILNIISTAVYLLYVIFLIGFMGLVSTFLSIINNPVQMTPDSIFSALYQYNFNQFETSAKIAGRFLSFGIIVTIASIILLVLAIINDRQYPLLSKLNKEKIVNSIDEAKESLADFSEDLSRNLRESKANQKMDSKNQNYVDFEKEKNFEKDEDFDETKILNRDEVINQAFNKKENENHNSDSLEIKRGAYNFASGFKKNSFDYKNEENFDKKFEEDENSKENVVDEKDSNFVNYQKDLENTNFKENEYDKKISNPQKNQAHINISTKDQKKYLFISLGVLGLIILFFVGKFVYFGLKPDAEFNTSGVDIKFDVNGYSGYANATATTIGEPILSQYKNKFLKEDIEDAYDTKISLDKKKNLKNGDVITATVKFTGKTPYKIAFSNDTIEKKYKVKGLNKFINSYNEISENNIEKFEEDIQKDISDQYISTGGFFSNKTKNLEISLSGIYEKKVEKEALENGQGGFFSLIYLYKVNYDEVKSDFNDDGDEVEKTTPKETYVVYEVSNIVEQNGAIDYNIQKLYYDIEEKDAINKIKFDGYKQVNVK